MPVLDAATGQVRLAYPARKQPRGSRSAQLDLSAGDRGPVHRFRKSPVIASAAAVNAALWWSYPGRLTDRVLAQDFNPLALTGGPGGTDAQEWKVSLPSWRDGSARRSVIAFLQEVTEGPDALPVAGRVAAFDNDGTLACEKPHPALAGFLLDRVAAAGSAPPEVASGHDVLREQGLLFTGQTTAQYEEQARRYLSGALHPRCHRPYPMLTYQPMLELLALLQALDSSVFMCTGSSRDFMRVMCRRECAWDPGHPRHADEKGDQRH